MIAERQGRDGRYATQLGLVNSGESSEKIAKIAPGGRHTIS